MFSSLSTTISPLRSLRIVVLMAVGRVALRQIVYSTQWEECFAWRTAERGAVPRFREAEVVERDRMRGRPLEEIMSSIE